MINFFKKYWPILVLVLIEVIIFLTNYNLHTYLLGWDVTMPELNIWLNLKRYIFGVWQEYRGLGTLDGQSYTANIVHWIYIFLLSLVLPTNMIRYAFTLLSHLIGAIGVYYLINKEILPSLVNQKKPTSNIQHPTSKIQLPSLVTALLYQLSFITVQMFYAPYETFTIHYAFIPWGIYSTLKVLKKVSIKNIVFFVLIHLLGISHAQVPTLFISYSICILIIFLFHVLQNKLSLKSIKNVFTIGIIYVLINSFWGIPYAYTTISKADEISGSKQHRYSTPAMYYRNQAYGDLLSVAKFGSFTLDYQDWNSKNQEYESALLGWREFYNSKSYTALSIFLTSFIIFGITISILHTFKRKNIYYIPFITSWLFYFSMLANDTPIINTIPNFFRDYIPLFFNIFRTPFTKFSLMYLLLSSIFFSICIYELAQLLHAKLKHNVILISFYFITSIAIISSSYLTFNKLFLFPELKIDIPNSYTQLISDLNQNYDSSRVAMFPIHSFWGWITNTTNWGYRGSGFLWQTLPQPIHDRAFDPWSKKDETAFMQMQASLYHLDQNKFIKTFDKYFTDLIIFDQNIIYPGGNEKVLFYPETTQFFSTIPQITLEKEFDNIKLYAVDTNSKNTQLYAPPQLTKINTDYTVDYTTHDQAYLDHGEYLLTTEGIKYPFSYLQKEEFDTAQNIDNNQLTFEFTNTQPYISFPKLAQAQKALPGILTAQLDPDGNLVISLEVQLPDLTIDDQQISPDNSQFTFTIDRKNLTNQKQLFISLDQFLYQIDLSDLSTQPKLLGRPTLDINSDPDLLVFSGQTFEKKDLTSNFQLSQLSDCPRGEESDKCVNITLDNQDIITNKNKVFVAVTGEFRSQLGGRPEICISESSSNQLCQNTLLSDNFFADSNWKSAAVVSPVDLTKNYQISIYLQDNLFSENNTIEYRNISALYYTLIEEYQVDLTDTVAQFDKQINDVHSGENIKITIDKKPDFRIDQPWVTEKTGELAPIHNCSFDQTGQIDKKQTDQGIEYLATQKGIACDNSYYPRINKKLEYLYFLKGETISGAGLRQYLVNPTTKRFDLEIVTPDGEFNTTYPIYSSTNYDNNTSGYFELNNTAESYGNEENKILIENSQFAPVPLSWLTAIYTHSDNELINSDLVINNWQKTGTTFYQAEVTVNSNTGILVLPQAYDEGWIALTNNSDNLLPTAYSLLPKYQYNGWANSWEIPQGNHQTWIIFWPQLLSFTGYGILAITLTILLLRSLNKKQ